MENYTRRVIHKDGRIEEVKVSKREVDKKINIPAASCGVFTT